MLRSLIPLLCLALILASCGQKTVQKMPDKEEMQEINRLAAKKEGIQIQQFVAAQKWPTTQTGSGLHYYIYHHGDGDSARSDMKATVNMVVTLLNGDTCYSWKSYGSESFVIDHDQNESGLHEAIKFMRVGDKAKIILPSHLAFGVSGDNDRIPSRSSVVYDLELIGLE